MLRRVCLRYTLTIDPPVLDRSGRYVLPNDETEQDRLDMQHHSFLLIFGGELYRAPLTRIERVLDVGCGTGLWAMDFGDLHPKATVIATDREYATWSLFETSVDPSTHRL